jgi:acetoin utilization deacetylase AcuC-like enzyme
MLVILFDPDCLLHETVELLGSKLIPALESPKRLEVVLKALRISGQHDLRTVQLSAQRDKDVRMARLMELASETHQHDYVQHLQTVHADWVAAGLIEQDGHVLPECFFLPTSTGKPMRPPKDLFARAGYYAFDMSSGLMSDSYRAIVASANLAYEGTDMLTGVPTNGGNSDLQVDTVFALCRPPGHHCDGRRAGGYCYINNAALAVSTWRASAPHAKVGVLDVDFHHGNGTQEMFYGDPDVLYVSLHGRDEFPYYTGAEDETGAGAGKGATVNFPLPIGCPIDEYLATLGQALKPLIIHRPEFLVVSLGFDTFHADPLGSFQIHTADYETVARHVRSALPDLPALILLEGGYVLEHLGANVLSFLKGWKSV